MTDAELAALLAKIVAEVKRRDQMLVIGFWIGFVVGALPSLGFWITTAIAKWLN